MFELTKKNFLRENGVGNGDTTKRSDVYLNWYRKVDKKDRLAAGNRLKSFGKAFKVSSVLDSLST